MSEDEDAPEPPEREDPPPAENPWTPLPARRVLRGGLRRRPAAGETADDADASETGTE